VRVLITGGAGYIGLLASERLLAAGRDVTVLDSLLHGQVDLAERLKRAGARVLRGDVRDSAARADALVDVGAVVHLAAIVGDPACARDPDLSQAVNVEGSKTLAAEAGEVGVERFIFASTCSNYGRMSDPAVPVDESAPLAPVSLYAEQKVTVEQWLLGSEHGSLAPTCLRFATVYGAAPRMRFDLTVNEFTRDLWAGRSLEVFGEQFWRPYVHAADAALGIQAVLDAPLEVVGGEVFNVGHSDENYRKLDLVELITDRLGRGDVSFVRRDEDPRDYKVSFEKVRSQLGFAPEWRVPDGIDEIVRALEEERFGDPFDARHSNLTSSPA
jgi:nucleoside-diphosphate-sugar epimerase